MKATKLPSGNWRVRVELPADEYGKRIQQSVTAPTEDEALAAAYALKASSRGQSHSKTFAKASRGYNEARRPFLSATTINLYDSMANVLSRHFPDFCLKPVRSITENDIQKLINALNTVQNPRHKGRIKPVKASEKTIRNYVGYIKSVLKYEGIRGEFDALQLPRKEASNLFISA